MFKGCASLYSIDLSNFETDNLKNIKNIFYSCPELSYIDISSFYSADLDYSYLFDENIHSSGKIRIKNNIYDYIINYIPSNWTIIWD